MREIRPSGSEGGVAVNPAIPTSITRFATSLARSGGALRLERGASRRFRAHRSWYARASSTCPGGSQASFGLPV